MRNLLRLAIISLWILLVSTQSFDNETFEAVTTLDPVITGVNFANGICLLIEIRPRFHVKMIETEVIKKTSQLLRIHEKAATQEWYCNRRENYEMTTDVCCCSGDVCLQLLDTIQKQNQLIQLSKHSLDRYNWAEFKEIGYDDHDLPIWNIALISSLGSTVIIFAVIIIILLSYLLKCCCFGYRRSSKDLTGTPVHQKTKERIEPLPSTPEYVPKPSLCQVLPLGEVPQLTPARKVSVTIKDEKEGSTEPLTSSPTSERPAVVLVDSSPLGLPNLDRSGKAARIPATRESQRLKPHRRTTSLTRNIGNLP